VPAEHREDQRTDGTLRVDRGRAQVPRRRNLEPARQEPGFVLRQSGRL